METSTRLFEVLRNVLVQLPSLLVIVACIIAALVRWKRHPKVSLTVVIALALLALHTLVFAFVYALVPDYVAKAWGYGSMQRVITVISFIYNSLLAIAMAVLLAGVFMKRPAAQQSETHA